MNLMLYISLYFSILIWYSNLMQKHDSNLISEENDVNDSLKALITESATNQKLAKQDFLLKRKELLIAAKDAKVSPRKVAEACSRSSMLITQYDILKFWTTNSLCLTKKKKKKKSKKLDSSTIQSTKEIPTLPVKNRNPKFRVADEDL